jgi:hypothetical protein
MSRTYGSQRNYLGQEDQNMLRKAAGYLRRHHVALLALFFTLGGTAYAAASLPTNSVGTKQIRNHAVTLGKISTSARSSLKGAAGAKGAQGAQGAQGGQGAQGAAGAQGAQGPKGDTGAAGAPGVSGLTLVSATSALDSATYKQLGVTCPSGLTAISGGVTYAAQSAPAPLAIATNQPGSNGSAASAGQTPDGWFGAVNEESAYAQSWELTVYAECAHVS